MENIFERKISVWSSIKRSAANRYEVTISYFLNAGSYYLPTIKHLRQLYDQALTIYESDPAESERLLQQYTDEKSMLPLATISGNFSDGGREENLLEATNLICLDIDTTKPHKAAKLMAEGKEVPNTNVTEWQALKWKLAQLPFVAYCALSVGGHGLFCIIPIDDYNHHGEIWDALEYLFKRHLGLTVDPQTRDITRPRFISYDDAPYFNENAQVFSARLRKKPASTQSFHYAPTTPRTSTDEAVIDCVRKIETRCIDITSDYNDWCSIAAALYSQFGAKGEDLFVRVSQFYPNASESRSRSKYKHCMNMSRINIGTFFEICRRHGITYKSTQPIKPLRPTATMKSKVEPSAPLIIYKNPLFPVSFDSVWESLTPAEFERYLSPEAVAKAQSKPLPF